MNYAVYLINLFTQLMIGVFLFNQIGKTKHKFATVLMSWYIPFASVHFIFMLFDIDSEYDIIQSLFKCMAVVFPMLMYREKLKTKIFMVMTFYISISLCELLGIALTCFSFDVGISDFYTQNNTDIIASSGRIMVVDVILLFIILFSFLYKRKKKTDTVYSKDLLQMSLFTLIHVIFLSLYYRTNKDTVTETDNLIQLVFQALLFVMIFVQYYNSIKTHRLMEYKREYSILNSKIEAEHDYYTLANEKFHEISELRHDIQNQIQTVKILMNNREDISKAENIIDEIQTRLNSVKTVNYCDNQTINALLTIKLMKIKETGISTEIILKDCANLPYNDYDICSLISNVLDNSVEECMKFDNPSSTFITIKSGIQSGYFLIRIENSCRGEIVKDITSKNEEGHGYGVKIIERICKKYNGSFSIKRANENAVATIALKY